MDEAFESLLRRRLRALEADGALRLPDDTESAARRPPAPDGEVLDLTSNDYLGLGRSGVSRETLDALRASPAGGRASRLIFGTDAAHLELERELADWMTLPAALLFTSGYAANVGTLAALAVPGDTIFSDSLNHASIIDGCRLSRATVAVYEHRNLTDLAKRLRANDNPGHRWVVTESYFSMDGDTPDLAAIRSLCRDHGASLIVDEAHALGVFGPGGAGLMRASELHADVLIGTLGKAVGAQGAFVAGSNDLRTYLWNRARSFVFSTATSPALATLTTAQLRRARNADDRRARLHATCRRVRGALANAAVSPVPDSHGPIVPLILGTNDGALEAAATLATHHIRARAIRPPTVPPGSARLRITLDATLTDRQVDHLISALQTLRPCRAS